MNMQKWIISSLYSQISLFLDFIKGSEDYQLKKEALEIKAMELETE